MWYRYLIDMMINPLLIFWLLIALALVFRWKNKQKAKRACLITGLFWLFLVSSSPIPKWLAGGLEDRYNQLDFHDFSAEDTCYIMVLGGGHTNDPSLLPLNKLSENARSRLTEGVRIYHALPNAKLVLSGYSRTGKTSQAELLALGALSLGVSPVDTVLFTRPANTRQEAEAFFNRFGESNRKLIVVTSALHLPRAILNFKRLHLDPIGAPCQFFNKTDPDDWVFWFTPSYRNIELSKKVFHEYLGLLEIYLFY